MAAKNQGFGIVALMCLGIFVCMIDTTIMNIALPAIQNDLHTSLETMSWMLNVYTMSIAVLSIPLARVAEIFGKGKFFILGALLFGAGSALCGFANSGEFLISARFVQSIGAAILMPISMIIGVSAVPVSKRHIATGILGSTQGLAAALGPTVGGIITQTIGWSWVFYVNVPICAIAVLLAFMKLELHNEMHKRVKIDIFGVILSCITIFSLTLGLVKGNAWGWNSTNGWICYIGFAISLCAFLVVESKVKDPMVNLALFRNRLFSGGTVAMLAATVYMVGVTVLLPQFLTHFEGKTELQAALLVTPVSATIFFIAPISGTIGRKLGNFVLILLGFLSLGMAYLLLETMKLNVSTLQIVSICVLIGAGFGIVIGPASMASAADFEGEMLTASQSVTQMFRQVGVVLAVAISISGLTHYLSVQKQEVLDYATSQVAQLDIPDTAKTTVLAKTKNQILNSDMNGNTQTAPAAFKLSESERQALIAANVKKVLATLPQSQQSQARQAVVDQVSKQVDDSIKTITLQIKDYSDGLEHHAKETLALSFSKLYSVGFPIVIASSIISLLFWKRKKAIWIEPVVTQEIS